MNSMIANLPLSKWQKEDLETLLEEYPSLLEMTDEELAKLSQQLYFKAKDLYESVILLENDAELIKTFLQAKKGNNF